MSNDRWAMGLQFNLRLGDMDIFCVTALISAFEIKTIVSYGLTFLVIRWEDAPEGNLCRCQLETTHSHRCCQTSFLLDAGQYQLSATRIPEKFTIMVAGHENGRKWKGAARPFWSSSVSVCHHFCHACTSQLLDLSYSREKLTQRP